MSGSKTAREFEERDLEKLDIHVDTKSMATKAAAIAKGPSSPTREPIQTKIPLPPSPPEKKPTTGPQTSSKSSPANHPSTPEKVKPVTPPGKPGQAAKEGTPSKKTEDQTKKDLEVDDDSASDDDEEDGEDEEDDHEDDEEGSEAEEDVLVKDKPTDPIKRLPAAAELAMQVALPGHGKSLMSELQSVGEEEEVAGDWADDIGSGGGIGGSTSAPPPLMTGGSGPAPSGTRKGKGTQRRSLEYEESESGESKTAFPRGILGSGPEPAQPASKDGMYFLDQLSEQQAQIIKNASVLNRQIARISELEKKVQMLEATCMAMQTATNAMSERLNEFDNASLQVIQLATSVVKGEVRATPKDVQKMEEESKQASSAIEKRSQALKDEAGSSKAPLKKKKKAFNFA